MPNFMTLGIIIAVVVVIGIIWYLMAGKKKGPGVPMKPQGSSTPMVPPTPPSSFNPPTPPAPPVPPQNPGM